MQLLTLEKDGASTKQKVEIKKHNVLKQKWVLFLELDVLEEYVPKFSGLLLTNDSIKKELLFYSCQR